jgi:hypothetical protein
MKTYSPEQVLVRLITIDLILVALFVFLGFGLRYDVFHLSQELFDFFHLGREKNLPTWFSSIQLFFVAYLAIIVANAESFRGTRDGIIRSQLFWYVIAAGFAFISLDEFTEIHESIKRTEGRTPRWVLVYGPIALLVACYSAYETLKRRKFSPQLPYGFAVAFGVMGAGAFGAEWAGNYMPSKLLYGMSVVVEEFCEMLGVSILIYTMLRYRQALAHNSIGLPFQTKDPATACTVADRQAVGHIPTNMCRTPER